MEGRGNRKLSSESRGSSISLQKKIAETKRQNRPNQVPDLTDFMNDVFFGTISNDKKSYNLTGGRFMNDDKEEDFESSTRSVNSRLTHEWLEEAKRMVASSPSRCDSPSRLVGSPRFASAQPRLSSATKLDQRDPLSRSARRHRSLEGFSGEILSKSSVTHIRNNSHSEPFHHHQLLPAPTEISPASAVHKWFSNILKPPNTTLPPHSSDPTLNSNQTPPTLPPQQSTPRKSRFQTNTQTYTTTHPHSIPPQPANKRTFKSTPLTSPTTTSPPQDTRILSPPKHLLPSAHRSSISSAPCSVPDVEDQVLSPPRKLVESARRRSVSSSTCSTGRIIQNPGLIEQLRDEDNRVQDINVFLREQRVKIAKIFSGEVDETAKIVLSGPSNGTSSMVAAICYAWLLENRTGDNEGGGGSGVVVVPVMSMRRERMWKQRQAAWLFHHVGVDATALLFSDEVELGTLMMSKQLSILVVGQDILRTNGEVGSLCTILTDNYCEHAYDLLEIPVLKKLLLAGILLDTQNLDISAKLSMTRDTDAVQLLSLGSAPNYSKALYDQLMQDHRDGTFFEALRHNYGKPPNESTQNRGTPGENRISERKSYSEPIIQNSDKNSNGVKNERANMVSPKSAKHKSPPIQAPVAAPAKAADASRGKNTFSIAKWFGFGK